MGRPRLISDERIAAVTRAAFLTHGPATPVSDIAQVLGVTQAALFHRVGSKEELLLSALCPGIPRALAHWSEGPSPKSLAHELPPVLRELLAFLSEAIPGLIVLRAAGISLESVFPPGQPPPPIALRQALAGYLGRARPKVPAAAAVADAIIGALEARVLNAWVASLPSDPRHDSAFINALVDGVITRKPTRKRSS